MFAFIAGIPKLFILFCSRLAFTCVGKGVGKDPGGSFKESLWERVVVPGKINNFHSRWTFNHSIFYGGVIGLDKT